MTQTNERPRLFVDIETYSGTEIKGGAFKYMEDPAFEILLIAYAWNDGPVELLDFSEVEFSERMIDEMDPRLYAFLRGLYDPNVVKVAHNSAFERGAFTRWLGTDMPPEQWEDTMILAAGVGLPRSLGEVAKVLEQNKSERHLRGGEATRQRHLAKTTKK